MYKVSFPPPPPWGGLESSCGVENKVGKKGRGKEARRGKKGREEGRRKKGRGKKGK